jgi:hypothetical protein|tara:strand:- start:486 stop:905 length:420 start_codon:yes stop_codon:yes gene_type:complete
MKLRLRKKCKFSKKSVVDMAMLHEDMELILDISKRTGGPEDYISELTDYFSDRPNIRKGLAPKTRLNEFVRLIAISQLESNKLSNMIDDVENGEAKVVQIAIVSPSKTGGKIYDTLEEQKKSNNEDITNFLNASDVAQA